MSERATRIEHARARVLVGLRATYTEADRHRIPQQWQRFAEKLPAIVDALDAVTWGVCRMDEGDGTLDYLTAVEVARAPTALAGEALEVLELPAGAYLRVEHPGHVAEIHTTWQWIWQTLVPSGTHPLRLGPQLERYGQGFDPATGVGEMSIWLPVEHCANDPERRCLTRKRTNRPTESSTRST